MLLDGARSVVSSSALKVTTCSLTYLPMSSCPTTCPLLDNGCMAQHGNLRLHTPKGDPNTAIKAEAQLIRAMPAYNPLRLRESGDQPDQAGLEKYTAPAAKDWTRRGGQPVWTYTHRWREIPRKSWGNISVLASVHSQEEALEAIDAGYAPALIYPEVPTHSVGDERYVWCPQQRPGRSHVKCRDCKLCFKSDWLHFNELIIVFTPHGSGKKKILAYYKDQKSWNSTTTTSKSTSRAAQQECSTPAEAAHPTGWTSNKDEATPTSSESARSSELA